MLRSPSARSRRKPLVGIPRAQVVEGDALLRLLGIVAVDALDLEQREIPLPLLRRANLPVHRVAGAQIEALDLRRRDVDVVRAVEVVPVLAAQKAVAFGQHLEHAFAREQLVRVEQILLDPEDEILLGELRRRIGNHLAGDRLELRGRFAFQLGDVHGTLTW